MRLFQINEDDLATLERDVPDLCDALMTNLNNSLRTKIRRVQQVLLNVRWNYGPPSEVIKVSTEPEE